MPTHPPRTLIDAIWHPLRELFSAKIMWGFLALVLLYKVGDALALSLYSTFMLRGMGFSLDELGIAGKLNMTVSTIIGTTFGGLMYIRWGTFRSLLIFGIAQALTNLLYMWLALAGRKVWLLVLATSVDTMVGGMGQAAFVAFLMSLCSANYSATQYALLSALGNPAAESLGRGGGRSRSRRRMGALLRHHLPRGDARTHFADLHAAALERARRARHGTKRRLARNDRAWSAGEADVSDAATDPEGLTRRYARCPRIPGPDPRSPHRWRPTNLQERSPCR